MTMTATAMMTKIMMRTAGWGVAVAVPETEVAVVVAAVMLAAGVAVATNAKKLDLRGCVLSVLPSRRTTNKE